MRKLSALLVLLGALTISFASAGQIKIGYCCNNFNDTFQTYIVDAAEKAAAATGVALEVMDGQEDDIRQQDQVNTLIQNGVQALIVVPVNTSSVQPIVRAAEDAGIPLIFVNRNPYGNGTPPKNVFFIGADSTLEGATQMENAGKLLNGKGNICVLMGLLSNEAALARTNGVRQIVAAKYPDIKILAEETGNWQRDQGMNVTENWLTAYGDDISAILSNNDEMALGAVMALANAGRDNVLVFGVDAIPDALQSIEQGAMTATVLQDPVAQGKGGIELAISLIEGKTPAQQVIRLPAQYIDKSNVKDFK